MNALLLLLVPCEYLIYTWAYDFNLFLSSTDCRLVAVAQLNKKTLRYWGVLRNKLQCQIVAAATIIPISMTFCCVLGFLTYYLTYGNGSKSPPLDVQRVLPWRRPTIVLSLWTQKPSQKHFYFYLFCVTWQHVKLKSTLCRR